MKRAKSAPAPPAKQAGTTRAVPASAPSQAASASGQQVQFLPPLKPRPRVLAILSILFALWIVALLVLYAKTVVPVRKQRQASQPALRDR
ncbi:MAG TPA: hypothetical protein VIL86_05705 [Tepidisphaeraceae bacterium]